MVVFSSFCLPESPVKQELSNVRVFLDKRDFGTGVLYISERLASLYLKFSKYLPS